MGSDAGQSTVQSESAGEMSPKMTGEAGSDGAAKSASSAGAGTAVSGSGSLKAAAAKITNDGNNNQNNSDAKADRKFPDASSPTLTALTSRTLSTAEPTSMQSAISSLDAGEGTKQSTIATDVGIVDLADIKGVAAASLDPSSSLTASVDSIGAIDLAGVDVVAAAASGASTTAAGNDNAGATNTAGANSGTVATEAATGTSGTSATVTTADQQAVTSTNTATSNTNAPQSRASEGAIIPSSSAATEPEPQPQSQALVSQSTDVNPATSNPNSIVETQLLRNWEGQHVTWSLVSNKGPDGGDEDGFPIPATKNHTATLAGDDLFIFGGRVLLST
jgi:hypothetical protein